MAMAAFRVVLRHVHINNFHCFFTPPPRPMSLLLNRRATWRHSLLSCRACSTNYGYKVVVKKDERLGERVENADIGNSTTIAAIVTSLGGPPAAVGIVRLSGPHAVSIAGRVFRPARNTWHPASHVVEYGVVLDSDGNVIDEVLAVPMLAPRSYTREDVVELQCHGSEVCLRRVLRTCLEAGATLAQPGEFTLRAFLNGRLDLSQAENVARLIAAKSVAAADAVLEGIQGGFSSLVRSLRNQCIELLAEIEARLSMCWRDPRATALFLIFCLVAIIGTYLIPFRSLVFVSVTYLLRPPRLRFDLPAFPQNFLRRMPAKSDGML